MDPEPTDPDLEHCQEQNKSDSAQIHIKFVHIHIGMTKFDFNLEFVKKETKNQDFANV